MYILRLVCWEFRVVWELLSADPCRPECGVICYWRVSVITVRVDGLLLAIVAMGSMEIFINPNQRPYIIETMHYYTLPM